MKTLFSFVAAGLILLFAAHPAMDAQVKQAARQPIRAASPLLYYESSPTQVIETFALMQQANGGNVSAQHELGYRYLVGRGLPADTLKAAEWIIRAANKGMALAQFNAGILHMNAMGVPWDPFTAFSWFKRAAAEELPAAEFALGLQYVDGLTVRKDIGKSYTLVARSATAGYDQAKTVLEEFKRLGFDSLAAKPTEKKRDATGKPMEEFVYLNFATVSDANVGDSTLLRELQRELGNGIEDTVTILTRNEERERIRKFEAEASRGIPEAFTVLGRMFERGLGTEPDLIRSAVYYLRANRLESPRAPVLLAELVESEQFMRELTAKSLAGDKDARYVWAALAAIEFDRLLGPAQALKLLEENIAAQPPHALSLLELGVWYATGRNVKLDPEMALSLWRKAAEAGIHEADVRIAVAEVLLGRAGSERHLPMLREEAEKGSVLAQTAVGFCLEKGIGSPVDKPGASITYRRAAQRGSQAAYYALKRMYDEIRPPDAEYVVD